MTSYHDCDEQNHLPLNSSSISKDPNRFDFKDVFSLIDPPALSSQNRGFATYMCRIKLGSCHCGAHLISQYLCLKHPNHMGIYGYTRYKVSVCNRDILGMQHFPGHTIRVYLVYSIVPVTNYRVFVFLECGE